jgi:DNA polymerase-3 subunit alpha
VRGAKPLASITGSTPMILRLDVTSLSGLAELTLELKREAKAPGEVMVRVMLEDDEEAPIRLGSDFVLDGDLAERLSQVEGIENVALEPLRGKANLKLVA